MALISVSKAGAGKMISITALANANYVVYTVPPGKTFSGTITPNATSPVVSINNQNLFMESYIPFSVELTGGTIISAISVGSSYSFNILGIER